MSGPNALPLLREDDVKISIEHAPGELAAKFEDVVEEIRSRAQADGMPLEKAKKAKKTIADLEAQIMIPASREMFSQAMDAISRRQRKMAQQVDRVVST